MKERSAAFLAVAILAVSLSVPVPGRTQESAPPPAGADAYPDGLVYVVEEGDTLWDLSAKYLGSPWRWQELWEKNRFLTNPHYIYPGIRLVIFPPPGREFALPSSGASAAAAAEEAPKPEAKSAAIAAVKKPPTLDISPSEYVRAGEFLKEVPPGIGRIRSGDEPKVAFSEGDKVFLKLDKEIPAGQLLGVYRVRGPIAARGDRPVAGYAKYLVGILQAKGKSNGEAVGIVRNSFEDLGRDDLLGEEIPSYAPVVLSPGGAGKLEATVVSGQWENEELAAGTFIFLDRGASSGVAVGDVFRLFDEGDKAPGGVVAEKAVIPVEVAQAVVVRVSRDYATAYVAKSQQSFSAGGKAVRGGEAPR
jgi:LysM repeat protein